MRKDKCERSEQIALNYGEKANIFEGDSAWEIYPNNGAEPIIHEATRVTEETVTQMMIEFAEGIRSNSNAGITNTFEEALLTNDRAEAMLKREYRDPYLHPYS
ncbi:MAG: hypothetical protein QNK33_10595 [Bacteroidales bacterium]|nr:hypothetical protein [Bacteroidales bacterium]